MRPKCPNHTCEMIATNNKRIFICPISSARFECDVEDKGMEKLFDKFGKEMISFKVTALDGEGG